MKKKPQQLFLEVADVFNITVDYNIDYIRYKSVLLIIEEHKKCTFTPIKHTYFSQGNA